MKKLKKLVTLDELAMCFCSAAGYGLGYLIPYYFGASEIVSIIICFIVGMAVEELAEKIIFSKFVQERHSHRVIAWIICIAIFIICSAVAIALTKSNLNEDLEEEFMWTLGIPIVTFGISFVLHSIKKLLLRRKYGDGSEGYLLSDKEKAYMSGLNGQNRPVTGEYDKKYAVKTETGIYVGKPEGDVMTWLGIPYAVPPVGELRWKKPVPLEPSDEVYEAKWYGASSVQPENPANLLNYHRQSEDCLYLNVWKSATLDQSARHPVLVYLHYGDFLSGGSADPVGEGMSFVENHPETVFVSFNYRLGLFGFIDFSKVKGGEQYPDSINCGLYDQIEALKWIHKNISAFGGDPDNITLMGAGSGATSALLLSTIEESKGLFRRIISVSASLEYVFSDRTSSEECGRTLAERFAVPEMSDLLRIPSEELKKVMPEFTKIGCVPSCNTALLPEDIFSRLSDNKLRDDLEIIFVLPENELSNAVASYGKDITQKILIDYYDSLKAEKSEKIWHSIFEAYHIERPEDDTKVDEFIKKMSTLSHIDIPMLYGRILSDHGHKVHCLLWDIIPDIEKFQSNATSFLATVLQNFEAGEAFGYICSKDLKELLQLLFAKYLSGEDLKLHHNEISGMDAVSWTEYTRDDPVVMHVNQKEIELDKHFRENETKEMDRIYCASQDMNL
ncbi:MAG: carboxylesterase family protein [Lachnospiraceae bacterium]|nr:carboxylesterase family protein [Lachnospiraceae bacterium]